MPKILLMQGANMSYLGRRQPEIYGTTSAVELDEMVRAHARDKRYEVEAIPALAAEVDDALQGDGASARSPDRPADAPRPRQPLHS